jgi:adenosylhomocysteinase
MSDTQATAPPVSERFDDVDDLVASGRRKLEWARSHMPILAELRDTYVDEQPFDDYTIGMAMHVEAKTGVLAQLFAEGGAEVAIAGCNPLSTHDDVSAALDATDGVTSYAVRGVDDDAYYAAIESVIAHDPAITVDDGGDLVFRIHEHHPETLADIVGGCEETTTGVHRLRAMDDDGALEYPVFAVNDTPMKRLFDNVHGTGESALTSIAATTNLSFSGKSVVVGGYGHCGRGVARKADGLGADVTVTEVDSRRALAAYMEGYDVAPMREAAADADVVVTTTGNRDVVTREAFEVLPDGVLLANAGHFDVEVDLDTLDDMAVDRYEARDGVETFELADGRRLNVLAEGRLVNLAAPTAQGHPVEVMDQSFGVQAVAARELVDNGAAYDAGVHEVPDDLDRQVADIKLAAEDVAIDELTDVQAEYMNSWRHGT